MRCLSVALIAAVSTIALSQIASAADIARPVYKAPPPAPIPVQDWSGIYVGLEGGYGWGDQNGTPNFPGHVNGDQCNSGHNNGIVLGKPASIVIPGDTIHFFDCSSYIPFDSEFQHFNSALADPTVALGKIKQDGWLFGGFFGAQKQWGSIVLGLEGDIDAADIKGSVQGSSSTFHQFGTGYSVTIPDPATATFSGNDPISKSNSVSMDSKVDMLASLRGKIGWSFAPDWMIYGTGGAAFAHVKNTISQSASVNWCDENLLTIVESGATSSYCINSPNGIARFISGSSSFSGTAGETMFGWAAGAGIDWKWQLDAGSALVFGVEYLHYGFPEQTITLADNNGASFAFTAKENVDVVKGRISYLFSIH